MLTFAANTLGKSAATPKEGITANLVSLMSAIMMPLVVLGAPFAGWTFDVSADYTLAFSIFGLMLLVGLWAISRVCMRRPEPGSPAYASGA